MEWVAEHLATAWVAYHINVYKYLKRKEKGNKDGLSSEVCSKWRRHNGNKVKYQNIHLNLK